MSKELKPCPFCGGEDVEHLPDGFGNWLVGCVTCDYRIQCVSCTEDEAIRYWNTRPAEDALKAENERLKEAIKEIRDISDKGLDIGIEFIGAGLDGMTGGVEDWEAMKRARRKVRRLAKQALKNRK